MIRLSSILLLAGLLASTLAPAVQSQELVSQSTVDVHIINFAFNPDSVTITQGDTVHWVWDTDDHSATSAAGQLESWDSGVHNTGFTFDHTFTQVGSFNYYCKIHGFDNGDGTAGGMAGTITVRSAAVPAPPALLTALLGSVPGLGLACRRLRRR